MLQPRSQQRRPPAAPTQAGVTLELALKRAVKHFQAPLLRRRRLRGLALLRYGLLLWRPSLALWALGAAGVHRCLPWQVPRR
jgi:hypothetical protein